jgi:hypothetical protein
MGALVRFATIPGLAAALSLCSASSAWAGDGSTLPAVQLACTAAGYPSVACSLPTINQIVVEIAALTGGSTAGARDHLGLPTGFAVDGTTQGGTTTLAFISAPDKATAPIPTQPNNPAANSFISGATSPASSPTTLNLAFSYLPRTNSVFAAGQDVGDITLPFIETDTNGNDLGVVSGTLHVFGTGGTAVNTEVDADLLRTGTPQAYTLAQLGMTFSLDFSTGHAVFDVGAPLLIPSDLAGLFSFAAPGVMFDPMDAPGVSEGINPIATFLDANFVNDANDPHIVNVDLAIGKSGGTVLSDPIPEPTTIALLGASLLGLAVLRRRRGAAG